jgi:hypothetical protein
MIPEQQRDVFDVLSDPATYGPGVTEVERIDTHISAVFLAGDRVYKLKRAVWLPFLDFSSVEQRHLACLAELAINRRTAPRLYLDVVAVTRQADGRLALGGVGQPVDWVVKMARFDQDSLFDRMAASGRLTREIALALADEVADFHSKAEIRPAWGGEDGLRLTLDSNAVCFAQYIPAVFDAVQAGMVTEGSLAWLTRLSLLLEQRRGAGLIRLCHGDLHLGNICLVDGQPLLFDAVEFNQDFASIDVLYDLAFLLMDMRARGLPELACVVFNRYLERRDDIAGLAALPLFLSMRAAIRAHVSAAMASAAADDPQRRAAHAYMDMAQAYLTPKSPRLLAVGGLSGSGKSRLARDLAPWVGAAPGALTLRTDVLRKRLMGVAPEMRLPPEGYSPEMTDRTYRTLYDDAARALDTGHSVIADAVFSRAEQRDAIEAVAVRLGVPFAGLWLDAEPAVLRERVATRTRNASDATVAVVERQLGYDLGSIGWRRIDASGDRMQTLAAARSSLGI